MNRGLNLLLVAVLALNFAACQRAENPQPQDSPAQSEPATKATNPTQPATADAESTRLVEEAARSEIAKFDGPLTDEARRTVTRLILSHKPITDLRPIASYPQVNVLWLENCAGVRDLKPLANLAELTELYLSGCPGVSDLSPLGKLELLNWLFLDNCAGVRDLTPLTNLPQLSRLSLNGCTGLQDLTGLEKLSELRTLELRDCTGIKEIPDALRQKAGLNILWP